MRYQFIVTYTDRNRTTLATLLHRQRVRVTQVGTPVPSPHREHAELGDDDGGADSRGHFLGGLDAETDVAFRVTDDDDSLEAGTLTGAGLLLDGFDLES